MRYQPELYAQALLAAVREHPKKESEYLKRFLETVRKYGDLPQAEKILAAVERMLVKERGGSLVEAEFARDAGEEAVLRFRKRFGARDRVAVRVNSRLVAGVRVRIDGERELDLTMERKLKRLFRNT